MSDQKINKKIVEKDIGNYSALESVKNTEGGKLIIKSLYTDIRGCIDELAGKYRDASRDQLVSVIADMSAKIAIVRSLNNSTKNKAMAQKSLQDILSDPDYEEDTP